jgi:hypothetical protein
MSTRVGGATCDGDLQQLIPNLKELPGAKSGVAVGREARGVSIGVQKGPHIGLQKGPPLSSGVTGMVGAPFALVAA